MLLILADTYIPVLLRSAFCIYGFCYVLFLLRADLLIFML